VFFQKALSFGVPSLTQTVYTILPMVLFSLIAGTLFKDGINFQKIIGMVLAITGVIVMVLSERNLQIK
jgi:multidrug transporter EmrE-like cation transporter